MTTLRAVLVSSRPLMLALVGGMMLVGYMLAAPEPFADGIFVAMCLSAWLVVGGQFLFNDAMDVEIDRKKPVPPPIARGDLRPRTACATAAAMVVAGLAIGVLVHTNFLLTWLGIALVLTWYSRWLTVRHAAAANVVVAACVTAALLSPITRFDRHAPVLAIAAMTFFATLTREIALDLEDATADAGIRRRSLSALLGSGGALRVAAGVFLLQIAASYVPWYAGTATVRYAVAISIVNVGLVIALAVRGLQATKLQQLGKASMVLYLAVILATR